MLKFADSLNRKDKGINVHVHVIMLKVSFLLAKRILCSLVFTRKISFLMNVQLFP